MNYLVTEFMQRELSLAQMLFDRVRYDLTDPLCSLSAILGNTWLSTPNATNLHNIQRVIEICLPRLNTAFGIHYVSHDVKHFPFQQIQTVLIKVSGDQKNRDLGHYLSFACTLIQILLAMDADYKAGIMHVDELSHARDIAKSAEEKARDLGVRVSISILDRSAQPVLFHRMHGAILISAEVAIDKARSAILMQMPSGGIKDLMEKGAEFEGLRETYPSLCVLDGGFPMYAGSRLIGGIGISGASSKEDVEIGTYAVTQNYLRLSV